MNAVADVIGWSALFVWGFAIASMVRGQLKLQRVFRDMASDDDSEGSVFAPSLQRMNAGLAQALPGQIVNFPTPLTHLNQPPPWPSSLGAAGVLGQLQANTVYIGSLLGSQANNSQFMQQQSQLMPQMQSLLLGEPPAPEPALDPEMPNTMGWRFWYWNPIERLLMSPHTSTLWPDSELRCKAWDEADVLRGVAGIHARLVPLDWRHATSSEVLPSNGWQTAGPGSFKVPIITGVVERFDRYVLGVAGWRAECVIIRKLHAPDTQTGLALEAAYPDVEVSYEDR